ncbi:hypothetical protein [Corallococcus silvisoli]|uniref:hypothetical protein n=1 Tax=Corallococcus silvisoli TaxID=2697031 RepID=UPI0013785395|nr:hypothetical protein [Corallococcus silvisoli]NBD13442.1 hypothetical protein [Corallococcus silvisoli]
MDLRPPRVEGSGAGTPSPRRAFAWRRGAHRATQGFFNLERLGGSASRHPLEGLSQRHEATAPRVLLSQPLLRTAGRFLERPPRGREAPVWALRRTVVNGGGRAGLLGFAMLKGDLSASPLDARSTAARVGGARV